jgi:hypothetical protein
MQIKYYNLCDGLSPEEKANLTSQGIFDELLISYHDEHGFLGEFSIRWRISDEELVPRIEMCGDSWEIFHSLSDLENLLSLFAIIGKYNPGIETIIKYLIGFGYKPRF